MSLIGTSERKLFGIEMEMPYDCWGVRGAPRAAMGQTYRTIRDLNTTLLPKTLKQAMKPRYVCEYDTIRVGMTKKSASVDIRG
ncbi:hypothetical protein MTR_1g057570 [Medicago truncatula]|uniref:Uncharacterized protein n=1 Tax=Medicago truncatula TaxID=3880 RepID=A0A072VKI8_MEDTR|nr:hypothetical protein MTR_1g057570 [Medicago truncatula]